MSEQLILFIKVVCLSIYIPGLILLFKPLPIRIAGLWILNLAIYFTCLFLLIPNNFASIIFIAFGLLLFFKYLEKGYLDKWSWLIIILCCIDSFVFIFMKNYGSYEQSLWLQKTRMYSLIILILPVLLINYRLLQKSYENLKLYFSEVDFKFHNTLRNLLWIIFFVYVINSVLVVYALDAMNFDLTIFIYLLLIFLCYYLFYVCQTFSAPYLSLKINKYTTQEILEEKNKIQKRKFDKAFLTELEAKIDTTKIYAKPELTLKELATELDINSRKLSQLINNGMNTNFYDLINKKRVNLVKEMLTNKAFEHYTIEAIGFEAGFNSKSALYTTFKKFEGQTPLQYKSKFSS